MKKLGLGSLTAVLVIAGVLGTGMNCEAAMKSDTIHSGIYIENMDISGMTKAEAEEAVNGYIASLEDVAIQLQTADGQFFSVTAGELGVKWGNSDVVEQACALGTEGNIVKRYKALRDLENANQVFPIILDFDKAVMKTVIEEKSAPFNKECKEAYLTREDGQFAIHDGEDGLVVNAAASADTIYEFLTKEWNRSACEAELVVDVDKPKADRDELLQVKDVLGTFTTAYKSSGKARSENVSNGCSLVNGRTIYPGEEFSMYEAVSPFSEDNGYYMAGSYLNGMVVDSLGGGICQVSTTLYNAVLRSELEVQERHNHSMIVSYVDPSADAAIAESSGKDFKFVNNTGHPIYIEGKTEDKNITFTIYGAESRKSGHEVVYESEVLSTTRPETEQIIPNSSQPIGFVDVQSAHVGYKAKLWKVVKEDGVEVSRTEVNSSSYKMVPRTATVGTATTDPEAYNAMVAAIATGSIDHVKAVAGAIAAANAQAAQAVAAAQAAAAQAVAAQVEAAN